MRQLDVIDQYEEREYGNENLYSVYFAVHSRCCSFCSVFCGVDRYQEALLTSLIRMLRILLFIGK